jgi:predicted ribosomally synthesized peptide with nif11-like leader
MSVTACSTFLESLEESAQLRQQLKAITAAPEMIRLAQRHGYRFDADDLAVATSTGSQRAVIAPPAPEPVERTRFDHFEYALDDVPELADVLRELPRLTVRPETADLDTFRRRFDADDLATLDRPPYGPEFDAHRADLRERRPEHGGRRDFHLVNLDEQVDAVGYDDYFAAKLRVVESLERVFDAEIRCSGNLWYPPGGYRLWHTNETQPGWRMYVVDLGPGADEPRPFFRYLSPSTGELVTLPERRRIVRFFKAEQDPDRLFWHCIANPSAVDRWSFGFVVPEGWQARLGVARD